VDCRCVCSADSVRCEEAGSGEIRARAPEEVVRRRERGEEGGECGEGGRRVRVVGKWPVWNVERGKRCEPERDLGSGGGC